MKYRPDIDGMRAIAVLSVVTYHTSEKWLPGGFIGVDIFFVISGYLITSLLIKDINSGKFSITRFYVRRSKRILPALFVSVGLTAVLGLVILTPSELTELGANIAATFGFVSNVTLWMDTNYFAAASEGNPLLHTWSLAVEEQFYILWPGLLLLIMRMAHFRVVLLSAAAVLFVGSCIAVIVDSSAAFFLLPGRGWELLVGALLAAKVFQWKLDERTRVAVAIAGLAAIGFGLIVLDDNSTFPGWGALPPCVGTAMLIIAGERGGNVVSARLLANRPMVFVGLVSYSFYLWHWPLLTLGRISRHGQLAEAQSVAIIAFAFVLSILSWRYVELPMRARRVESTAARTLVKYGAVSLVGVSAGLALNGSDGLVALASPELAAIEKARLATNPLSPTCLRYQQDTGPLPGESCISGKHPSGGMLVLWGDSHADSIAPGVVEYAKRRGLATYQATMIACPPLIATDVVGSRSSYVACNEFNRQVIEFIEANDQIKTVFMAARWSLYTENARFGSDDIGHSTYLTDAGGREKSNMNSRQVFPRALGATIAKLRSAGKEIVLLASIPPIGKNVPTCLARNMMPMSTVVDCRGAAQDIVARIQRVDFDIQKVARSSEHVCVLRPTTTLCSDQKCMVRNNGTILYADDDHLTESGARYVIGELDRAGCNNETE